MSGCVHHLHPLPSGHFELTPARCCHCGIWQQLTQDQVARLRAEAFERRGKADGCGPHVPGRDPPSTHPMLQTPSSRAGQSGAAPAGTRGDATPASPTRLSPP